MIKFTASRGKTRLLAGSGVAIALSAFATPAFAQNTDGRIRQKGEDVVLSWPAEHSIALTD